MSKKSKFLASSLAGLNIVGMAASTSSNTVKAFNLTEFLLNFLGKSELFRKLFSSLYTGLNEYKYSDIVLDGLGYTNLAAPVKEGETVNCDDVTLVAKKIGSEKNNILMWRAQSKTKSGKAVYICDQQTWEEKIFPETNNKNAPEYVSFFLEKFRRKSIDDIKVLTENGFDGLLNSFKEKVKQAKYLVNIEELLSSKNFEDIQYDEFWDYAGKLGLPRPENVGDKIAIVKSEGLKKLKENEDYLNGKIGAYFSNYLENEDFYELTAFQINGKWCWVNYTVNYKGNIEKVVCLHLGGEKPTGDKTPVINLDEKKLLEVLPGFEPYLKKRKEFLEKVPVDDTIKKIKRAEERVNLLSYLPGNKYIEDRNKSSKETIKSLSQKNKIFEPLQMRDWLNGGWHKYSGENVLKETK